METKKKPPARELSQFRTISMFIVLALAVFGLLMAWRLISGHSPYGVCRITAAAVRVPGPASRPAPAHPRHAHHHHHAARTVRTTRIPAPSPGTAQATAWRMLPRFGWNAGQYSCLNAMWTRESGWQAHALNPGSGAYGIPQALPAAKMATAGPHWRTSAATQIRWGLGYIRARYGSPCNAWLFWQRTDPRPSPGHWY